MNSQKLWEASLANRAENTRKNYLRCFREFAEWVQKTPNELREMKYKEDLNSKPWDAGEDALDPGRPLRGEGGARGGRRLVPGGVRGLQRVGRGEV